MVISAISDGALDPTPVDTHIPQQSVIKPCQLDSGLYDAPFAAPIGPESADVLPTFLDEIVPTEGAMCRLLRSRALPSLIVPMIDRVE
jgi:hypothetical protein